jgi:hypothetical protein
MPATWTISSACRKPSRSARMRRAGARSRWRTRCGRTAPDRRPSRERPQEGREVDIGLDDPPVLTLAAEHPPAGRKQIEGPIRRPAAEPVDTVERRETQVSPLAKHLVPFGQEIQRTGEGRYRSRLRDRARIGGALRLDRRHRGDEVGGTSGIADAPARHRISLGDAVAGQHAVEQPGLDRGDRCELPAIVANVLLHIVGQHHHVRMVEQDVGDGAEIGRRIAGAGGVARRIEHQPFGARCDRGPQ